MNFFDLTVAALKTNEGGLAICLLLVGLVGAIPIIPSKRGPNKDADMRHTTHMSANWLHMPVWMISPAMILAALFLFVSAYTRHDHPSKSENSPRYQTSSEPSQSSTRV